jgi:2-haloacid dehalogenase
MADDHPAGHAGAASRGFRTAYVHRPLEWGPGRESPRPEKGRFDYAVDSFAQLADELAAG